MTEIGYQHGITAMMNRLRDLDPNGTLLQKTGGKWPSIDTLAGVPIDQWKAYDKAERAFTILVHDHDGATNPPPDPGPDPGPDPEPTYRRVAPRVAYKAGYSDARYCLKDFPNLRDDVATYDANGLCTDGRRSDGSPEDCPTSALEIDGRELCELPMQGDPLKNTGSWLI